MAPYLLRGCPPITLDIGNIMRNYARIAIILSVLGMIILISPLIIGFYLQRNYQSILNAYTVFSQQDVAIDHFYRGWFHSVAKIRVHIGYPTMLEYINLPEQDKSLMIEQRIQHGPFFYHDLKELPYFIGLASMQNNLHPTVNLTKVMHVIKDIDYLSFRGSYHKYFKLASINLIYPKTDIKINIDNMEGKAWISTKQQNVKGNMLLQGIAFHNADDTMLIPSARVQFDNGTSLWLGNNSLTIPSVSLIENGNTTINVRDLAYQGYSEVANDMMNGANDLFIHKINIGDYEAGPFHLKLSVNKLNATAVNNMIESYHLIMRRGELYQSQLTKKMIMMFPDVLNKGTHISLNNFDLKTQDGQLHINGEMVWNMDKASIPDQIGDILSAADAKVYLKIAKPLMNRWLDVASSWSWFNQVNPELDQFYRFAQFEMVFTTQLNTFGVLDLVAQGKVQDNDARLLLWLQKMNTTQQDYAAAVKELLWNKIISQETSYTLLYLYAEGRAPLDSIRFLLERNQQKVMQNMSLQLQKWIKSGYIQEQQNDYMVSFVRQKNQTKFNTQ